MAEVGSQINLAGNAGVKIAEQATASANEASDIRRNFNYPLVKYCDMSEEMRTEAIDTVVSAVEKHSSNYEAAAKMIKESMDKRCGTTWHVIVGEGYGFEITHEVRSLLYMYFGGELGILVFKAS